MRRKTLTFISCIVLLFIVSCYGVYNGIPVQQGQFPYLVYIMVNPGQNDTYACGGGILNSRYVISAGHCSFGNEFQIIVGRIDVDGYYSSNVVEATVVRPDTFGQNNIFDYDDVAIWTLATPVEEVPGYIEYMDLGLNAPPVGTNLELVGYGEIGVGLNTALAHYGQVTVSNDDLCRFSSYTPSVSFCLDNSNVYSCPGDSGSPLVVKPATSSRFICVGLDSYGHAGNCGQKEPDTVVTKIAAMVDWIRSVTPLEPVNFQTVDYSLLQYAPPIVSNGSTTPIPTPSCWTCPPGQSHWFDFGYEKPTNGDRCQCMEGTPPPTTKSDTIQVSEALTVTSSILFIVVAILVAIITIN
jgi:hypothetical protein